VPDSAIKTGALIAGAVVLLFIVVKAPGRSAALSLPRSAPVRVEISDAHISVPIMQVGRAEDGSVAVPPLRRAMTAGWYSRGPSPGENGAAVIVGHVDSVTGPGAFLRLHEATEGDEIKVTRKDGSVAVFDVDHTQESSKKDFPANRVLGSVHDPELRLITCAGRFNWVKHSYDDNLIVYARLVAIKNAPHSRSLRRV
jgi:sortase (surface protein transpeptidase)